MSGTFHKTPRNATRKKWSALWSKRPTFLLPVLVALSLLAVTAYITGTKLEEHDSFCASCHTHPEQEFFSRSQQSPATDLASFHAEKGVLCIQCHAGKGIVGRTLGLMAGAQDLVAFWSGHYPSPAKMEDPLPDANCTRCHADVVSRGDFNNHFHFFLAQWQNVQPQKAAHCVSCHSSHTTAGKAADMFLIKQPTLQVCQQCHSIAGG